MQVLPDVVVEGGVVLVVEVGRVLDGPEDVKLELGMGPVAEPHGANHDSRRDGRARSP